MLSEGGTYAGVLCVAYEAEVGGGGSGLPVGFSEAAATCRRVVANAALAHVAACQLSLIGRPCLAPQQVMLAN